MSITVVIHTENKESLLRLFRILEKTPRKSEFYFYLHSKNYAPWEDETLKNYIVSFKTYNAFLTDKSKIESIIDIVGKISGGDILILDENCVNFSLIPWSGLKNDYLFCKRSEFLQLKLDTKYEELSSFIIDLKSQKNKKIIEFNDDTKDSKRYNKKLENPLFFENIIYVDGGLGDHIMALPLLEKLSKEIYISCKYEFIYQHLSVKGFIPWTDDLFGGYKRFVYEYGSANNSKTIIDAFFKMYGYNRNDNDVLKYNGVREPVEEIPRFQKFALICTSAAKIQGLDSNKDWRDIRWMKLVNELQKQGFFVVQVGAKGDNQIPNVNLKCLDLPISKLAYLIQESSLWFSVDTFFHHFAASINPTVGICLTPFYNDHAKHAGVTYIERDCGKNYYERRWWLDLQQPERKECMDLIQVNDVVKEIPYVMMNSCKEKINLKNVKIVNNRTEFLTEILKDIQPNPVCIELGTYQGDFSKQILDILNPEKLYLVDPWIVGSDENGKTPMYGNRLNLCTAYSSEEMYEMVLNNFSNEIKNNKVFVLKDFSYNVVKNFIDGYFDFIYLDACHLYDCAKSDLKIYLPKLKKTGFMCGHDYFKYSDFGVMEAVNEFCKKNNFELILYSKDGYDWALKRKQR